MSDRVQSKPLAASKAGGEPLIKPYRKR